ncbi:MAG: PspA/IM30 family protein [Gallionella sp.]|nr:PspA/IM30 family protein [Gallionella sp.]
MAETIAARVARIIAGGTHALIDKAENLAPDAMMAQSIREIAQVIDEVRFDMGKAEAAKHLVMSQIARLNAEHEKLADQALLAIRENRDDLACAAIARQSDIEDYLPVLHKSLDEQSARAGEFERYILALQAKRRELEQMLSDYQTAQDAAASSPANGTRQMRAEDAGNAFARVLARQPGGAGLNTEISQDAVKLRELADMQRANRIAERLAALKLGESPK